LTTVYHWTSNTSLWWEFLRTEVLLYIDYVHRAVGGWVYLHQGWAPLHFVRNVNSVHEWILLRKVEGKRFASGMASSVAQLRALKISSCGFAWSLGYATAAGSLCNWNWCCSVKQGGAHSSWVMPGSRHAVTRCSFWMSHWVVNI